MELIEFEKIFRSINLNPASYYILSLEQLRKTFAQTQLSYRTGVAGKQMDVYIEFRYCELSLFGHDFVIDVCEARNRLSFPSPSKEPPTRRKGRPP